MKLVSGGAFWPMKDAAEAAYPALEKDLHTEVVVIGGGITSALVSLALHEAGAQVALVSDQRLGGGSTSASTALLQYEIDENLMDLKEMIGAKDAVAAYRLCGEAIDQIAALSKRFPCDFAYRPSVLLAAEEGDLPMIRAEYEARAQAGFAVRLLDRGALMDAFGFDAPGAIQSELGAEVDPYKLTQRIFEHLHREGVPVYERTEVVWDAKDGQRLRTRQGHAIRAGHAVFATGYRSQAYLAEQVVQLHSTYAFVTPPLPENGIWHARALWWDSADPYIYARMTADGRAMIGGGDRDFYESGRREAVHDRQIASVLEKARRYAPSLEFTVADSWNGVFGETKDGLAYIGTPGDWKHADFALGFGGNGITYSQLAARMLAQRYKGEEPEAIRLFRFGR